MKKGSIIFAALLLFTGMAFASGGSEGATGADGGVGFNAAGLPITKEPVTLEFAGILMNNTRQAVRHDKTEFILKLAEETNVSIRWNLIPQDSWQEKKNLIVASGELPDGFLAAKSLSIDEIQKFGADGVLIKLDELLDKYAPNIKEKMAKFPLYETFTRSLDGNIYALSQLEDNGFDSLASAIIRTEWLDILKLDMPTTTEEFYEVLKAFKTQDPNGNGKADEIPFSFLYLENPPNREVKREHYWIFPAFGVYDNPMHVAIDDDGELMFTADRQEWREAVEYLHRLYSEGLIDPEVFSQDRATLTNKVRNELLVGAYTDYRFRQSIAAPENEDKFGLMPPLTGPNGDRGWLKAMVGLSEGAFAITSSCEIPEVAVRWIDYTNTDENVVQMQYGMFKPAGWNTSEALIPSDEAPGKYIVNTDLRPSTVQPSEWPFSSPISMSAVLITKDVSAKYVAKKDSLIAKQESCDVYRPYLSEYPYNYPFKFTVDEIEELSLLQTDLLNYIYTTEAKWIVNGFSDSDWKTYTKQLGNLGVDQYVKLYETSYERSK